MPSPNSAFVIISDIADKFCLKIRQKVYFSEIKPMATTQLTTRSKAASFPAADITNALRKWWEKEVDAVEKDPFAPPVGTLADALPVVDSLTVVRILTRIESHLDFELPVSVVKRGGYHTLTEMTDHLLKGISKLHHQKHPTKP